MSSAKIIPRKRGGRLDKMTDKQRIFVHEYLADDKFNAAEAAKKAGYKNPSGAVVKLLSNKNVVNYLGIQMQNRIETCEIKAERVLQELACIGFSNIQKLFDGTGKIISPEEWDEATARSVSSIKVTESKDGDVKTEIRFWNKNDALMALAKHLGLLSDNLNLNHNFDPSTLSHLLQTVEEGRRSNQVIDAEYVNAKVEE